MCGLREETTPWFTKRIHFNSIVYSDSKNSSIQRIVNILMWRNTNTPMIMYSYKAVGLGKLDIQTVRTHYHRISRSVDTNIINHTFNIVAMKSEGQTHLYIEHSIMIKVMLHEIFLQLRCIYCNCTYSRIFYRDPVKYYWNDKYMLEAQWCYCHLTSMHQTNC